MKILTPKAQTLVSLLVNDLSQHFDNEDLTYLTAKALLETGFGTSGLYNEANNMWGMKYVLTRPTTRIPDKMYMAPEGNFSWYPSLQIGRAHV